MREGLEKLLAAGKDNALLRFGLGNACLAEQDLEAAVGHLRQAVSLDPDYTAAWKLLGRALVESGRPEEALEAIRSGIDVAQRKGDKQAEKEMNVYFRRAQKILKPE